MEDKVKKSKKNWGLVIVIALAVITIAVAIIAAISNKDNKPKLSPYDGKSQEEKKYETQTDCIYKGFVCDIEDMGNGISMDIAVNNDKTYKFYVIANDENTLTLMSIDAAINSKWSEYGESFWGPEALLNNIQAATSDWVNIPALNYEYEDDGYKTYQKYCMKKDHVPDGYSCDGLSCGIGYKKVTYNANGLSYIPSYSGELGKDIPVVISNTPVYARTITYEEMMYLFAYNKKISWLEGTDTFWTMSSVTDIYSGYYRNAHAFKQNAKLSTGLEGTFRGISEEHLVYPVITINKVEKDV